MLDQIGLKEPLVRRARQAVGAARFERLVEKFRSPAAAQEQPAGPRQRPSRAESAVISLAPHSTALYDYFIRTRLAQGNCFITSRELYSPGFKPDPHTVYILLRHDIDYTPATIEQLTDIERSHGIRSDIYVIMSERHYDANIHAEKFRALARDGFVFGLHTLAPQFDDFFTVLRREIGEYRNLMGDDPEYFTIHGPPSPPERPANWGAVRANFIARIAPRLASFGFRGSHNISGVAGWIEDAALGGEFSFLETAWVEPLASPGQVLGVLTHPCHWTHWPIKWRVDPATRREAAPIDAFVRAALRFDRTTSSR